MSKGILFFSTCNLEEIY